MASEVQNAIKTPIGIVLRRNPGINRWAGPSWRVVSLIPGAAPANWKKLRTEGDITEFHAATVPLTLFSSDTEAYVHELGTAVPSLYAILRTGAENTPFGVDVHTVTASPYEAQGYSDSGEEIVERVVMPKVILDMVHRFVAAHHEEEPFVKRRRKGVSQQPDTFGVGDPRIRQVSDVFRAPRYKGKVMAR